MTGRRKILVADDEPLVLETITAVLEERYDVVPVGSGAEALRNIRDGSFDLLFTDIIMPGVNGFQLAAEAKKLQPELRVLYGTGFMEAVGLNSASLHGSLIRKPYRAEELLSVVEQALVG